MADKPEADQDQLKSIFDSDIGNDWGEAFEADEFMPDSKEESSSEFFLEDEFADTISTGEGDGTAGAGATQEKQDVSIPTGANGTLFTKISTIFLLAFSKAKGHLQLIPSPYRIPVVITTSLLITAALSFLLFSGPDSPPPALTVAPTPQNTEPPKPSPEKIAELDSLIAKEAPKEQIRQKWHFPSFLISTNDNMQGDDIFFVEIDITLIMLTDEEKDIPQEKSILLRDLIYQFFSNRPLYELRRYSLARGEMNRKLRSWIEKQWPEGQIATIVFNRYQLL